MKRLASPLLALAAAVLVLAIAAVAGASPRLGPLAAPIAAARHQGTIAGDTIRFRSELVLGAERPQAIELTYPLPEGAVVEPSLDLAPVTRDGRIVALRLQPDGAPGGRAFVTVVMRLDRKGGEARLTPPLAAGPALQIVDVTGPDDLRFEPLPRTEIARHVGFFAPADLPPSARDACDRLMAHVRSRTGDDPMYVLASAQVTADEGIRGSLSTAADRLRTGALGAGAIFAALVAGLAVLWRRLARAAKIEQAERALAAEFAKLEP
jgi:hypothetical protein